MVDILVPISFFAMIAAIVIVPRYLRSQETLKLQETLRAAIDKGQPLPPEVVEALTTSRKPAPSPDRDLRRGVVLLAVGVGLATMGLAANFAAPDAAFPLVGAACIPAFMGLALIIVSYLSRRRA